MMVSVLVPSRQRAKLLFNSLATLGSGDYEVLVWVDDDDPQLQQYLELPATVFIRPRVGYENFHQMINFLAKESMGEWLLLWNDDMRIEKGNLSNIVEQYDFRDAQVLNFWDPYNPRNNLAPIISRDFLRVTGHFSLSTHCDSWVQDIANELGIHKPIHGIEVTHLREVLDDVTKKHSQAVYSSSSPLYDSEEMVKLREKDITKLKESLA